MLNDCVDGIRCTIEQHAINNRVELIVMSGRFSGYLLLTDH